MQQAVLVVDVVVQAFFHQPDAAHVAQVAEDEDVVFAKIHLRVQAHPVLFDKRAAEELVPQRGVVEVCRARAHPVQVALPRDDAARRTGLQRRVHPVDPEKARDHEIAIGGRDGHLDEALDGVVGHPVVGVGEVDPLTARAGNACVARGGHAGVGLGNDVYARVGGGIALDNLQPVVGAAVVDGDDLQVSVGLVHDARHSALQVGRVVVEGDDDADQRAGRIRACGGSGGGYGGGSGRAIGGFGSGGGLHMRSGGLHLIVFTCAHAHLPSRSREKKAFSSAALSSASTPPQASKRWFRRSSAWTA